MSQLANVTVSQNAWQQICQQLSLISVYIKVLRKIRREKPCNVFDSAFLVSLGHANLMYLDGMNLACF